MTAALKVRIDEKRFAAPDGGADYVAISRLRFEVAEREFVCIVGPSGSGKTTTLNIIGGLDPNFEGEVAFRDPDARERLAYVFQEPRLLPWRTLLENVALPLGKDRDAREKAKDWLERVGLGPFAGHFPGQTSLGMQRRAALARAFAFGPSLMLMDEPFVSLDEATAQDLRGLLMTLWRNEPVTVLFVTHNVREAIGLANRILLFSKPPAHVEAEIAVPLSTSERETPQMVEAFRARHFPSSAIRQETASA